MTNLEIKLQTSKWLTGFLLVMHLGAICCVLLINLPIWLMALLIILISYSFYTSLPPKNAVLAVAGVKDAFISQYLIILHFNKSKKPVVIGPDSTDKQSLRALRVLLRNNYA